MMPSYTSDVSFLPDFSIRDIQGSWLEKKNTFLFTVANIVRVFVSKAVKTDAHCV